MRLTGLHKPGVGPSLQAAETVKFRNLPDTAAAGAAVVVVGPLQQLQPKSDICAIYRPNDVLLALR